MEPKRKTALQAFLLFAALTLLSDQLIHRVGSTLEKSPYWDGNMATNFVRSDDAKVFLFGDCRAAWYLDPQRMGEILNTRVFNAGTTNASMLGFTDFYLNVAISRGYKGHAVFVLTDYWFTDVESNIKAGFNDQRRWQNFIEPTRLATLNREYPFPSFIYESGYYRYFGRGTELLRSLGRLASGRKLTAFSDGYLRPDFLFQDRTTFFKEEKNLLEKDRREKFLPNQFAENKLRALINTAKSSGLEPVLVMAPVHSSYATKEYLDKYHGLVNQIAYDSGSPLINFQAADNEFSNNNGLWLETVHLNYSGSLKFSTQLAIELDKIIHNSKKL